MNNKFCEEVVAYFPLNGKENEIIRGTHNYIDTPTARFLAMIWWDTQTGM
jgi:hypothetical protein